MTAYTLRLGTTGAGSDNVYTPSFALPTSARTATSVTVSGLPQNGATLYARLYSLIDGVWEYTDYTYTGYTSPPS